MLEIPKLNQKSTELEPYFSNKKIRRTLILQLNKDFYSAGIKLKLLLTKNYSFDELIESLCNALDDYPISTLFNLLYRVDVSESQLAKEMATPGFDIKLFAQIIVKRELQKVVLRMLYSSNNNEV